MKGEVGMGLQSPFAARLPWSVIGVGVILGIVLLAELLAVVGGVVPVHDGFVLGAVTSVIAVAVLLYGGYSILASELSAQRYGRLIGWCFGATVVFLLINLGFMLSLPPETPFQTVSWVRWAASLGGAVGVVIGLFEARTIERIVEAERQRVRQAKLRRERDQLEEFANIVSHDLRSPLSVAMGRLELAEQDCDSEHLDHVANSLDRMETLIQDLLALAREGRQVEDTEPVGLESLFRACWTTVDTDQAICAVRTGRTVLADRNRLRQAFENLIRNAIDHNDEEITITLGELDDGFYIEDTGSGIAADDRGEIFETGYSTDENGTGFGLSIVRRIIDAHGWEITVTGSTDGGARFEITGVAFAPE